jgi:hypothetical protein
LQRQAERSLQLRFLVLIGILAGLASPASAVEKATVAQVEQILADHALKPEAAKPRGESVGEVAEIADSDLLLPRVDDSVLSRLSSLELTERMSTLTLYRLVGQYKLGAHAQMVLEQMADRSALLKLPAGEEIPLAAPDTETQSALFNAARDYVFGKLSHLPDFVAMRTTTTFDNAAPALSFLQAGAESAGYRRRDVVQKVITFRDGREVLEAVSGAGAAGVEEAAFQSTGEFGTQAAVVLMDIEQGAVSFDHWENTMGGVGAVYRYSVPRGASHYEVTDRCAEHGAFHDIPGYHGSIALSPRSGALLRITLEAEAEQGDPVSHVASVIEYGPVIIGKQRSTCPLRSIAFMVQEAKGCSRGGHKLQKPIAMVNQTIFSNYHRFGSSSTIIFDEADSGDPVANVSPGEAARRNGAVPPAKPKSSTEHTQP